MANMQDSSVFYVALPNGQNMQVDVEPSRTASKIAEVIARKAGLAIEPGRSFELYDISTGKPMGGSAKELSLTFASGTKIGIRKVQIRASSKSERQDQKQRSRARRYLLLLVLGVIGYWAGWRSDIFPLPVQMAAGWRWILRSQLLDAQEIQGFLKAHPPKLHAVYADRLLLLEEPGWNIYCVDYPVTEELLRDWFAHNRDGYFIFLSNGFLKHESCAFRDFTDRVWGKFLPSGRYAVALCYRPESEPSTTPTAGLRPTTDRDLGQGFSLPKRIALQVTTNPIGAIIKLDGDTIGQSPITVDIAGKAKLVAEILGCQRVEREVTVSELNTLSNNTLSLSLERQNVVAFSSRDPTKMYLVNCDGSCLSVVRIGNISRIQNAIDKEEPTSSKLHAHSLSPDGRYVAIIARWEQLKDREKSYHYFYADLFIVGTVGQSWYRTTHRKFIQWEPIWSPDSSRFAFTSHTERKDGSWETGTFVVDADGTDMQAINGQTMPLQYTSNGRLMVVRKDRKGFQLVTHSGRILKEWKPSRGEVGYPCPVPDTDDFIFLGALEDTDDDGKIQYDRSLRGLRGYDEVYVYRANWDRGEASKILQDCYDICGVSPDGSQLLIKWGRGEGMSLWDLKKQVFFTVLQAPANHEIENCHWVYPECLKYLRKNDKLRRINGLQD